MPYTDRHITIRPAERARVWAYGSAPIAVVLALAAHALITPELHNEALFLYFVPPVLVATGVGGLGPGLLATALSLIASYFFLNMSVISPAVVGSTISFAVTGCALSWGGESCTGADRVPR